MERRIDASRQGSSCYGGRIAGNFARARGFGPRMIFFNVLGRRGWDFFFLEKHGQNRTDGLTAESGMGRTLSFTGVL